MLVALVIAVGLVGIIVPMLPGDLLVLGAILVWSAQVGGSTAWVVFALAAASVLAGTVVKYVVPGRRLKAAEVPGRTLVAGAVLAVVGFFVVPVVGLPLGFLLGIYLAEWHRQRDRRGAGTATVHALRAVGLAILIEFAFALIAALIWATGLVLT